MAPVVPEALSYSELRSLGRVVYEVFGGSEPILIDRRQDKPRPYWRIDAGPAITNATASGFDNGNRILMATYCGTGQQAVMEKGEILRSRLGHGFPYYAWDSKWMNPRIEVLPADGVGPNLDAGEYTVSVSFNSIHDDETLPSSSFNFTLNAPGRARVYAPAWPFQNPLRGYARFYIGAATAARRMAAEVALPAVGWASALITEVPTDPAPLEQTKSQLYIGPMEVLQSSMSSYEDPDRDGLFDCSLTLTCRRDIYLPVGTDGWRTYQEGEVIVTELPNSGGPAPSDIQFVVALPFS